MSNMAQLSARDRILTLLDDNSFVEVGAYIRPRNTDFNLQEKNVPADGVITGYGVIGGNLVYIYSQDATALGGSVGEMHAKKIANIYDLAQKVGAPIIGFLDSTGLRLEEATDALHGFGEIYSQQIKASGVIPQITAIMGNSGGGLAVMSALSDFTFMEENKAKLFVNAPNSIKGNYKEKLDTSSASFQVQTGLVDFIGKDEQEILDKIRELIEFLPANFDGEAFVDCDDDLNRELIALEGSVNDTKKALIEISDNHNFYEMKSEFAKEMVTGFIRLNGLTIGAIANRVEITDDNGKTIEKFDGSLTTKGCKKAADFTRFCDGFNIPILTLTNVNGYMATADEEISIAKEVAKMTYEFSSATVAKVNLIVGLAYGSSYIAMNSKHIGADMVFALPNAKIAMMDADLATRIIYPNESGESLKEKSKEYAELQSSAISAASRGYVDNIIEPSTVRQHLVYSFEMLYSKSENKQFKKHGTI